MRTKICILLIVFIPGLMPTKAQVAFYDSKTMDSAFKFNNPQLFLGTLRHYLPDPGIDPAYSDITSQCRDNPFLNKYITIMVDSINVHLPAATKNFKKKQMEIDSLEKVSYQISEIIKELNKQIKYQKQTKDSLIELKNALNTNLLESWSFKNPNQNFQIQDETYKEDFKKYTDTLEKFIPIKIGKYLSRFKEYAKSAKDFLEYKNSVQKETTLHISQIDQEIQANKETLAYNSNKLDEITSSKILAKADLSKITQSVASTTSSALLLAAGSTAGSASGASFETMSLDAMAKFLAERFKEEIKIYFFEQLQKVMNTEDYKILRSLFPQTTSLLDSIESYTYANNIGILRNAFISDFSNSPYNLEELIRDEYSTEFAGNIETQYVYLLLKVIDDIKNNRHPAIIIRNIPEDRFFKDNANRNLLSAIKALKIISEGLRDTASAENGWISGKVFQAVKADRLNIFLGLIYQSLKDLEITPESGTSVKLVNIVSANKQNFNNLISSFIEQANNIDNSLKLIKTQRAKGEKDDLKNFIEYYRISYGLIPLFMNQLQLVIQDSKQVQKINEIYLSKVGPISNTILCILSSIDEKNWYGVFGNTIFLLEQSLPEKVKGQFSALIKYGNFMANVAVADNSEDIKKAIETIALPVGSYSIKRKSYMTISLNGYVGANIGEEKAFNNKSSAWAFTTGFLAPVGLNWSFRSQDRNSTKSSEWSWSLFASIIDLGAITQFRLDNDSVQLPPAITFSSIFAPGLFFACGIKDCPVSIIAGFEYTPQLRKLTYTTNNNTTATESANAFRISLGVAVDIPIFNFYVRQFRGQKNKKPEIKFQRDHCFTIE
jgi:hypothetical protein